MNGESAGPALLATTFIKSDANGEHISALKGQVEFTLEIFKGLLDCCAKGNGVAAECLLRTLFDSAINAIILAKHPEKMSDFLRHGKFTQMRMARYVTAVPDAVRKHLDAVKAGTEDEWQALLKEFKNTEWHKCGTRESFVQAEYQETMYDKYFRPASAYAHAEPYVFVYPADKTWSKWVVEARPKIWQHHAVSAYNMACFAMLHMLGILSRELKLGYEEDLKKYTAEADAYRAGHMEAMREAFEEHFGSKTTAQPESKPTR